MSQDRSGFGSGTDPSCTHDMSGLKGLSIAPMNLDKVRPNPSPTPRPASAPRPRRKVASALGLFVFILVLVCALAFCWMRFGRFSEDSATPAQSASSVRDSGSTAVPTPDALPATLPELVQLADAGNGRAAFELGERYRQGRGAIKDGREAFKWYVKAGETKDIEVSYSLGVMFDAWDSELSNHYRVFSSLEAAALCGHQRAQLKLAELNLRNTLAELNLRNTREYTKDSQRFGNVVDAYAWLNICAAWGDGASASRRDELESEIKRAYTPATLAQCQARSRQLLKIIESNKTSASKVTVLPAREN